MSAAATLGDAVFASRNEKLERLAFEAWQKFSTKDAGTERREYVAAGLKLEATWTLIEQFQPQVLTLAIGQLLNRTKGRIAAEGTKNQNTGIALVGGGRNHADTQHSSAPTAPSPDDEAKRAKLRRMAEKQQVAAKSLAKAMIRMSRLDTVMVFGKAIGDCTVAEVRGWIAVREKEQREASRDVLFARNMISNLPSSAVIREWWKGDDVDAAYTQAEAENAE